MSASTMVETYDMPMADYVEDGDIPMGGSSSENAAWFQPLPHMDEDARHIDALSESQEVDMMAFEETTTEYEMADEDAHLRESYVDPNVIDAEVYDMAFHSSPLPPVQTEIIDSHIMQPQAPDTNVLATEQSQVEGGSDLPTASSSNPDSSHHFPSSDGTQVHDALSATAEAHSFELASVTSAPENSHEHLENESENTEESTIPAPQPEGVANAVEANSAAQSESTATSLHPAASEGRSENENAANLPDPEAGNVSSQPPAHEESSAGDHSEGDETLLTQQATDGVPGDSDGQVIEQPELQANHQAYMQPPPIFLSLQVTSTEGDQPDFVLFSLPETSSHTTEEPLLLLQHHPSLFYEPVSAVFEAFRREEYFSHLEELSEAEMALNAHELQLVISEDNIYAREVSLQDLYAMHQGVGLPGHLRLTLQSVVPRFIARYNHLRDQITRLVLADEAEDTQQNAAPDEEGGGQYIILPFLLPDADIYPEHDTQEHADTTEPVKEQTNLVEGSEVLKEYEGDEDGELVEEGEREESDRVEEAAPESGEGGNEEEQETAPPGFHGGVVEAQNEQALPEGDADDADASGEEDDAAYDLDADAVHAPPGEDSTELPPEEHATEYVDAAEPREEDDEGYGDEVKEDGEDGTGMIGDAAEARASPHDEENVDEEQQKSAPEADGSQSGVISHSTSSSSFDADNSSWEDAAEGNDDNDGLGDGQQETDQSIQRNTITVFDEEGNYTEGFEAGEDEVGEDNFDEDDFEDSAEGTLKDPTEELGSLEDNAGTSEGAENDDEASRAVLAESEKFVSTLADDDEASEETRAENESNDDVKPEESQDAVETEAAPDKPKMIHKNASKRSLDDAELESEEVVSLSSSPDSKRTRTL